jgi:hypothetical protein
MMSDGWDASMFAPFLRMINAALLKTNHLRSLVLRLPPDPQGVALERCSFPLMNHYASNFDSCGDFLERHRMIKNITVLGEGVTALLHPAHLPFLEVFSGPAHLVPDIVPGRPVHSAKLWWPLRPWKSTAEDEQDSWHSGTVVNSLAQSTFQDGLVVLENLFWYWPPLHILNAVATSLTLRFLFIRSKNYAKSAYNDVRPLSYILGIDCSFHFSVFS